VSEGRDALDWADAQIAAARDDPAARLALMERLFHGPTGRETLFVGDVPLDVAREHSNASHGFGELAAARSAYQRAPSQRLNDPRDRIRRSVGGLECLGPWPNESSRYAS
jgi:hypothetical protein